MPDVFLNQSGESSKANKKNRHPESNDSGVPFSKAYPSCPSCSRWEQLFAAAFAIAGAAAVAAGAAPSHDNQHGYEQENEYVRKFISVMHPML